MLDRVSNEQVLQRAKTIQAIPWRWLLPGKSDLWVVLWERINWKPLYWPDLRKTS